jgi:APA family basic amino acid/polyamine antiporter
MSFLTRRKPIDANVPSTEHQLKKTLGWPHLIAFGVGAIVGTGIYTLTGVGAGLAGPGVILSFAIAGAVCVCAALAYAEMATMMPYAGSAYTYTYSVLGETLAWIVGTSLILEYTVVCSAVAVGWSAHAAEFIRAGGWGVSNALLLGPGDGGLINLPAIAISIAVALLLMLGTRESATVSIVLVVIKIAALAAFVVLALPAFNTAHFTPFMPNGFAAHVVNGTNVGVMAAAAIIFFAFYGFDAVSTAAEETKNPARDLKIGIIGSMLVCTAIYMIVAAVAIGASPVTAFSKTAAPLVYILNGLGQGAAAKLVAGAAVLALPTVIMSFMYGQSRIFFVMARDGMLPTALAKVNARTGTPILMTAVTGIIAAALAGFLPLTDIAALANAGTLAAFIAVAACMIVMRLREPDRPRQFTAPVWWLTGSFAIVGCIYLFASLPNFTKFYFAIANAIGFVFYLLYGARKSQLAKAGAA